MDRKQKPLFASFGERKGKKRMGILLPFNEIIPFISHSDNNTLGDLSTVWISFVISKGFLSKS